VDLDSTVNTLHLKRDKAFYSRRYRQKNNEICNFGMRVIEGNAVYKTIMGQLRESEIKRAGHNLNKRGPAPSIVLFVEAALKQGVLSKVPDSPHSGSLAVAHTPKESEPF
jgi:hypothetical protein